MKLSHLFKILFMTSTLSVHAVDVTTATVTPKLITQTPIAPHFSGPANFSQEDIEPIVDWEKKQNAEQRLEVFGDDFLGDAIDPHTGS